MDPMLSEPQFPQNYTPATQNLTQIFKNVTTSYKYFWFLGILEAIQQGPSHRKKIPMKELAIEMVGHAWYTVHYFKLSFGPSDLLDKAIHTIHASDPSRYSIELSKKQLGERLYKDDRHFITQELLHFLRYVPFRFLTPWLGGKSTNSEILHLANAFTHDCPYRLIKSPDGFFVEINPSWKAFLTDYIQVLRDYTYWHLAHFVQKRNPSVPGIINKLRRPDKRISLVSQRKLWQEALLHYPLWPCIFSNQPLSVEQFALDHFIPWSFVTHNQMWNLIPINKHVNSAKSNHLPDLNAYLSPFVLAQQQALSFFVKHKRESKFLQDYGNLFDIEAFIKMPNNHAEAEFRKVLSPLIEIAGNTGFQKNWTYHIE